MDNGGTPGSHLYRRAIDAATTAASHLYARWSPADRDDLVQEVMLRFLRQWQDTTGPDNLEAWITTATRNAAIDLHRGDARRDRDRIAVASEALEEIFSAGPRLSILVVNQKVMGSVLALLNQRDRELLQLRYLDNLPARDVAGKLGMRVNGVDQATRRAKQRLAEALANNPELLADLRNQTHHAD